MQIIVYQILFAFRNILWKCQLYASQNCLSLVPCLDCCLEVDLIDTKNTLLLQTPSKKYFSTGFYRHSSPITKQIPLCPWAPYFENHFLQQKGGEKYVKCYFIPSARFLSTVKDDRILLVKNSSFQVQIHDDAHVMS